MATTIARSSVLILCAWAIAIGGSTYAHGSPSRCASGPTRVYTFTVETRWAKKSYKVGETARVRVTVTRPAHEDPLREGLPWPIEERVPVEGATVTTSVQMVFPQVGGYAKTDEEGVAKIKFEVAKHLKGPAHTYTEAKTTHRTLGRDCTDVEEYGGKSDEPAFTVRD